MLSPLLVLLAAFFIVTAVLIRPVKPPTSPAFAHYRRRLRRNLAVSLIPPVAMTVYALIASAISASHGERVTQYPPGVYTAMDVVVPYGFVVFPLIGLLVTELGTEAPATRVATLAPRSPATVVPRWLLAIAAVMLVLALLVPTLALTTSAGLGSARAAVEFDLPVTTLWLSLIKVTVAAALATWLIRLALQRPDIDPDSASDSWSRSGVAVRATSLSILASAGGLSSGLSAFSDAWWDFRRWSEESADPGSVHSPTESMPLQHITNGAALAVFAVAIIAVVSFAKPPVVVPRTAEPALP